MVKKLSSGRFEQLTYRDEGQGFPLMLVHGFPMDGHLWDAQVPALRQRFRLLVPDLPGSGASPLTTPLSIADMAESLHDILRWEQIGRCVMVGHSLGGYVTLAFAEKYPRMLQGFGLFHSTAYADTAEKRRDREKAIALMEGYGSAAFLRQMMPGMFSRRYRSERRSELAALIQERSSTPVATLVAYYRAMMARSDRTAVLEQTKTPVLFVMGKEDVAAPAGDMLQQALLPALASVHAFGDVAHLGMLEHPEQSARILEDFAAFCVDYPFNASNPTR